MQKTETPAPLHWFSHDAMATTFQIGLAASSVLYARQAATAAFEEIDRLESELSRFIPDSDIARINRLSAGESIKIGADAFECLCLATGIWQATSGAFDPTVGALLGRSMPDLDAAVHPVGMNHLRLTATERSVSVVTAGVVVDLGALGKGYAVDAAGDVLSDWGIADAVIHSGQSSVLCMGDDPRGGAWKMPIRHPLDDDRTLGWVELTLLSLSGSGQRLHGPHILDPRTRRPCDPSVMGAWAAAPSAAVSDALSTAFMIMTDNEIDGVCRQYANVSALRAIRCATDDSLRCTTWGPIAWIQVADDSGRPS